MLSGLNRVGNPVMIEVSVQMGSGVMFKEHRLEGGGSSAIKIQSTEFSVLVLGLRSSV